jgi:hypothetical protein
MSAAVHRPVRVPRPGAGRGAVAWSSLWVIGMAARDLAPKVQ